MRPFLGLFILLSLEILANDLNTCKGCHPIIYNEFQQSFHKKSTIKADEVHRAVWDKHPAKAKGDYKCAKCHAPDKEYQEITCVSCHTIKGIEEHSQSNSNIYETKDKTLYSAEKGMEDKKVIYHEESSWLGLVKRSVGSPYHDIDYTNKIYYNGKLCMGCHSHKRNENGLLLCQTDMKGAETQEQNCITCHMPQVEGSATNIRVSKTHAYHGFAGVRHGHKLLSKYVDISFQKLEDGFNVTVENKSPHKLLTHPLRVLELKVTLKRNGKVQELKQHKFMKILGESGKPSMPWLANTILKDNMIKGKEKRSIKFDMKLQKGDEVEAILGFYVVNPKAVKKLKIENGSLSEFTPLKREYFRVNN